jgi:uncharacterized membrane protein
MSLDNKNKKNAYVYDEDVNIDEKDLMFLKQKMNKAIRGKIPTVKTEATVLNKTLIIEDGRQLLKD